MEVHEPYHSLPRHLWKRAARELQAEERRTGRANYAAVPPSEPLRLTDAPYAINRLDSSVVLIHNKGVQKNNVTKP